MISTTHDPDIHDVRPLVRTPWRRLRDLHLTVRKALTPDESSERHGDGFVISTDWEGQE